MSDGTVYFEIYAPACEHCSRPEERREEVSFDLRAKYMLDAAGFEDWPIWEQKSCLAVAEKLKAVRTTLGADSVGFALLPVPGKREGFERWAGWDTYAQLMKSLTRVIDRCEELPKGFVKVNVVS